MSTTSSALLTLLEQAERDRDAAMASLTQLSEAQARLSTQQHQLQAYRRDYHARWTAQFRQSGSAEVVRHYQGFVERLNQALEQLELQMAALDQQLMPARQLLIERETRVMALRKLLARRDGELLRRAAQREQKSSDELAARMAWLAPPVLVAEAAEATR